MTWTVLPPQLPSLDWEQVWSSNDTLNLRIERTWMQDIWWHRIEVGRGIGAGAVTVPVRYVGGAPEILLVHQDRMVPRVSLWECPRGLADDADADLVATGLREFREETGIEAESGELIGTTYADSGIIASQIGIVLVRVAVDAAVHENDGEVDDQRWFSIAELDDLIASAQLRDGISLAALSIARAWAAHK